MWRKYNTIDFDDSNSMLEYDLFGVSVFDHVLSEQEAFDTKYICYQTAVSSNVVNEYCMQEKKLVNLILHLRHENGDGYCAYDKQEERCEVKSPLRFNRLISLALKEKYRCMGPLVFNRIGVVLEFGFDQTHNFYVHKKSSFLGEFKAAVKQCGLFVL